MNGRLPSVGSGPIDASENDGDVSHAGSSPRSMRSSSVELNNPQRSDEVFGVSIGRCPDEAMVAADAGGAANAAADVIRGAGSGPARWNVGATGGRVLPAGRATADGAVSIGPDKGSCACDLRCNGTAGAAAAAAYFRTTSCPETSKGLGAVAEAVADAAGLAVALPAWAASVNAFMDTTGRAAVVQGIGTFVAGRARGVAVVAAADSIVCGSSAVGPPRPATAGRTLTVVAASAAAAAAGDADTTGSCLMECEADEGLLALAAATAGSAALTAAVEGEQGTPS